METNKLRIVYMGTPEFAVPPLQRLVADGYNVVAVVTAPDKPAGRGLQLQPSAVKQYALQVGLRVLQPVKLKDEQFVSEFRALQADLGIVIAFRMLPEVIWAAPRLGTFNLHASLLPQYRGAAPINWAVINGEMRTGLTTFLLDAEIDKGAVLGRLETAISSEDTAGTVHDRLMAMGPQLVVETVEKLAAGSVIPVPQQTIQAGELKPAPKIFREDCRIDWTQPGRSIVNLIRGLSPYPAAWSELVSVGGCDALQIKILSAHFEPSPVTAGAVVSDSRTFVKVVCADGYILLDEVQVAGKKRMSIAEFLRGFQGISTYSLR